MRELIKQGFRILIRDEQDTNFWGDNWTGKGKLRVCFPRIIALARSKSGSVKNFER